MKVSARVVTEVRKQARWLAGKRPTRKIVYDHLPKCGGMSFIAILKRNYLYQHTFDTNRGNPLDRVARFQAMKEKQRHRFHLVVGHQAFQVLDLCDPACLKVTVLRDPVERLISHYFFARETPYHYLYETIQHQKLTLLDYAKIEVSNELNNWYTTHFSGMDHSQAMKHPAEAVSRAAEVLTGRFDRIGFLDQLDSFIQDLCHDCGLTSPEGGERANVTKSKPDHVDPREREVLRERNALDVELYEILRKRNGMSSQ